VNGGKIYVYKNLVGKPVRKRLPGKLARKLRYKTEGELRLWGWEVV
jgi:hypothetical protein